MKVGVQVFPAFKVLCVFSVIQRVDEHIGLFPAFEILSVTSVIEGWVCLFSLSFCFLLFVCFLSATFMESFVFQCNTKVG